MKVAVQIGRRHSCSSVYVIVRNVVKHVVSCVGCWTSDSSSDVYRSWTVENETDEDGAVYEREI